MPRRRRRFDASDTTTQRNLVSRNLHGGIIFSPFADLGANQDNRLIDDGIDIEAQLTELIGNKVSFNSDLGIEAVLGVTGTGNWAKHNGNRLQSVPSYLCITTGKPKS